MNKEQIRDWLDSVGHDRFWLAEQIGTTKGTVDQWFSKGFPEWAVKSITRLVSTNEERDDDPNAVKLTLREFEMIDRARRKAGYQTRREFYRDAIVEFADKLLIDEDTPPNVKPITYGDPEATKGLKAADEDHPRREWGGRKKSAG